MILGLMFTGLSQCGGMWGTVSQWGHGVGQIKRVSHQKTRALGSKAVGQLVRGIVPGAGVWRFGPIDCSAGHDN